MAAAPALRTDTLLSIENVSLSYGSNVVLKDVNARIQDLVRPGCVTGQVCGLLGPSGIGKSTVLRIMAGLQKPTTGAVYLGANRKPVAPGDVGMVSQASIVYRNRDVMSNIVIAAENAADKPSAKVAKQRAVDILNDFGLLDKAQLYPVQLSGGQRQRVSIAQQMVCCSDFLVFDEPTAGLDPIAKAKTCELIGKLASRSELETLVICSHDIPSVVTTCDTVWLLGRTPGVPGARIVEEYDLIERGLAYHDDVTRMPEFADTVRELSDRFSSL